LLGELPRQDGDENDVVDPEDDLEERQGDEGEQTLRGQEGIHSPDDDSSECRTSATKRARALNNSMN
jgi:hypothetical protein